MAEFYFVGGEDSSLNKSGIGSVDTALVAARRTANARCSLRVGPGCANVDGWVATWATPRAEIWISARVHRVGIASSLGEHWALLDAVGNRRLSVNNVNSSGTISRLNKRDSSGTVTLLTELAFNNYPGTLTKFDLHVIYGGAGVGQIRVFFDGALVYGYSGDLTTNSAITGFSGFKFGGSTNTSGASDGTYWSEIIVSDTDTRSLNLVTLAPSANGNAFTFDSGSAASINETTLDDSTLIASATAGQLAQFTVNTAGITNTPAVKAVVVTARAAKGGSGPQNAKMVVRSGGVDSSSATLALPAALGHTQAVFATNPNTGASWTAPEITAAGFNVGIRTEA